MQDRSGARMTVWGILGAAAAYFGAGKLALALAVPDYPPAVWLPAGVAMAAVLLWGPRASLGAALGSLLVNFDDMVNRADTPLALALVVAAGTGLGAGIESLVGFRLVRRFIGDP